MVYNILITFSAVILLGLVSVMVFCFCLVFFFFDMDERVVNVLDKLKA
jgi:hypothetical protein